MGGCCSTSAPFPTRSSPQWSTRSRTPMPEPRSLAVAFLDRDGNIIADRDYTNNPDDVVLLRNAAAAIARLSAAGYGSIVVTNQSGIARGLVSLEQYRAVRQRLDELLRGEGAAL